MSLLELQGLSITFVQYDVGLRRRRLEVVTDLDLTAEKGELVAVVGSSGSGKSLLAHALLDLLPSNAEEAGEVRFDGRPLGRGRRRAPRGREIALISQAVSALDPLERRDRQTARAATLAGARDPASVARDAYRRLELDEAVLRDYPHELSGGMARRVLTATGAAGTPRLVLADEPAAGLHPEVVAEMLAGLRRLADGGTAVVPSPTTCWGRWRSRNGWRSSTRGHRPSWPRPRRSPVTARRCVTPTAARCGRRSRSRASRRWPGRSRRRPTCPAVREECLPARPRLLAVCHDDALLEVVADRALELSPRGVAGSRPLVSARQGP